MIFLVGLAWSGSNDVRGRHDNLSGLNCLFSFFMSFTAGILFFLQIISLNSFYCIAFILFIKFMNKKLGLGKNCFLFLSVFFIFFLVFYFFASIANGSCFLNKLFVSTIGMLHDEHAHIHLQEQAIESCKIRLIFTNFSYICSWTWFMNTLICI